MMKTSTVSCERVVGTMSLPQHRSISTVPFIAGLLLLLLVSTGFATAQVQAVTCVDNEGQPVEWWAMLKSPDGYQYSYLDAHSTEAEWRTVSGQGLETPSGNALGETLRPIYDDGGNELAYVMYNDNDPNDHGASSVYGHTKGVVAAAKDGGYWMIHSTPRFPNFVEGGYHGFPEMATKYGQSFLCLTLPIDQLELAAGQFLWNRGHIYDSNLSDELAELLPTLKKYIDGEYEHDAGTSVQDLQVGDFTFVSFAKNKKWDNYLYENFVAPHYETDLAVESWMNGRNPDETFCPNKNKDVKYEVSNIRVVGVADDEYGSVKWKETMDHSKWAVSLSDSKKIACIGDINRQASQNGRPGGTVCIENELLWTAFSKMIVTKDEC